MHEYELNENSRKGSEECGPIFKGNDMQESPGTPADQINMFKQQQIASTSRGRSPVFNNFRTQAEAPKGIMSPTLTTLKRESSRPVKPQQANHSDLDRIIKQMGYDPFKANKHFEVQDDQGFDVSEVDRGIQQPRYEHEEQDDAESFSRELKKLQFPDEEVRLKDERDIRDEFLQNNQADPDMSASFAVNNSFNQRGANNF